MVLAGRSKLKSFQKLFSGGHLFVFIEYLCNRSPKIKTKNIKNYSSILAILNRRNWLDDSPPLRSYQFQLFHVVGILLLASTTSLAGVGTATIRQFCRLAETFILFYIDTVMDSTLFGKTINVNKLDNNVKHSKE